MIDRIPFPRPDDPLMAAGAGRAEAGGNGFMTVSATHAALRLAQGAGRLIRRSTDRGVVAVPGQPARDRPLRAVPADLAATVLGDHRPRRGGGRPAPPLGGHG